MLASVDPLWMNGGEDEEPRRNRHRLFCTLLKRHLDEGRGHLVELDVGLGHFTHEAFQVDVDEQTLVLELSLCLIHHRRYGLSGSLSPGNIPGDEVLMTTGNSLEALFCNALLVGELRSMDDDPKARGCPPDSPGLWLVFEPFRARLDPWGSWLRCGPEGL